MFFIALNYHPVNFGVYLIVNLIGTLIVYNVAVIIHSMGFFFGNFEESAERWYFTMFGMSLYPQTVFSGSLKIILMTFLPAFFIAALPVKLLLEFQTADLLYMIGFWFVTFIIAMWIFRIGLRRYESGNLINVKL